MANTYNLFISHSWVYGDAYDKLTKMLDEAGRELAEDKDACETGS